MRRRHYTMLWAMLLLLVVWSSSAWAQTDPGDVQVLQNFVKGVKNPELLGWKTGTDPCSANWKHVKCQGSTVTGLQIASLGLGGTVTPDLNKLNALQSLQLQNNGFTGPLPTLSGLSSLQSVFLSGNSFDTIPADFFVGLSSLTEIYLDDNLLNRTSGWTLPADIQNSTLLSTLSLTNTSLGGTIPDFLGQMPGLKVLNVAYNKLSGGIPAGFSTSNLAEFRANNQQSPVLSGTIGAVGGMQSLRVLWLHVNAFTGPIPAALADASSLQELKLNDNHLTGTIPTSLTGLPALKNFTVKSNSLVGSIPRFNSDVDFQFSGNDFCMANPGEACAPDVAALLDFLGGVGYPDSISASWTGNNPCGDSTSSSSPWLGVSCGTTPGTSKNVTVLNLASSQLNGTLSPSLGNVSALVTLRLSNNKLSGLIPDSLTRLPSLESVDLSNNLFSAPVPVFPGKVKLNVVGNPLTPAAPPQGGGGPQGNLPGGSGTSTGFPPTKSSSSKSSPGPIIGVVVGLVGLLLLLFAVCLLVYKKKGHKFLRLQGGNTVVVHPRTDNSGGSADDPEVVKIVVNNSVSNGNSQLNSRANSGPSDHVQVVEAGNLIISIHVLREATKNFSEATILGRGGFGVVYKGVLDDGTAIAVKRMEAGSVVSNKGLSEFQAEIAVLTKVRHRHLVALLGYCIEGNEKMLVYEYMPQGTLSQHLFETSKCGYSPLDWKQRLSVALDVARGMEYLHGLAHKSFIHRDLKPSNILLGDDLRAKVSDFGLVKLAPDSGKFSVETRLAGTFGYLAPEYAVTGRVTTKADVFSFGVVLMELLTGRRALDETQAEENMHLVTWFRRTSGNKEGVRKLVDPVIEVTDDVFQSVSIVAELAGHCTAREPYQRPDMGHAVNVLSPLVEHWKPAAYEEESAGIDLDMPLPQAVKRWQELDSTCWNDTQSSLPPRPSGFAESFTSDDAR